MNALTLRWSTTASQSWWRGPESHRRRQAYETCLGARTLPTHFGIAGGSRTRTRWPLMPVTLPSWSTATNSSWECWDSHPVVQWRSLYRRPRCLNRQHSRGVVGGTRTRLLEVHGLVSRLLRHRPQSAWKESHLHLSLIRRVHELSCYRRVGAPRALVENSPSNGQIRSSGCHTTAARFSEEERAKQAASELNAATRIWRPSSSQTATHGAWIERLHASCIREDSNLYQRRSHCRVPSLERIQAGPDEWNRTTDNVVVGDVLCS